MGLGLVADAGAASLITQVEIKATDEDGGQFSRLSLTFVSTITQGWRCQRRTHRTLKMQRQCSRFQEQ